MFRHAILAAALASAAPAAAQMIETTPRIAIMSAFEPEWTLLQDALTDRAEVVDKGVRYITGTLDGEDVVLALTGISMTNAAMTSQMLIDRFAVSAIVVSGIAGGVDPALNIGDVSVAAEWAPYLNAVFAREVSPGVYADPPIFKMPFPNYGMIHPTPVEVRREGAEAPQWKFWFAADPGLLAAAERAAAVPLESCAGDTCLATAPKVVLGGHAVSGAAFVDNADFREYVFETFEARVLDMETAAIAQVAYANDVPFIAFRSVSDLAGGEDGANELPIFFSLAAANSAAVVRAFIAELSTN